MKLPIALAAALALTSCSPEEAPESTSSPAETLIQETIVAHGGLEKWYGNGAFHFRWTYNMRDRGVTIDTRQTLDPSSLAVVHEVVDKDIRFGMKDGTAWITPADATFMPPPRFWSLTPTYFIGIPWVFNDPGANFEILPETKAFENKDYTQLKITYDQSAGDSPDDYYVLLIDPETKLVRGTYYTVTHPMVLKDGKVGPEKFLTLDNLKDINGLKIASGHRTFKMNEGVIGEIMRDTNVSEVKFVPLDSVDLSIPEGAKEL